MKTDCVIPNYIPHNRPHCPDFKSWLNYYKDDIECLFEIFQNEFSNKFSDTPDLPFEKFAQFIFVNSSQHIKRDL